MFALLISARAEQVRAKRRSQATVDFYTQKAGHWLRVLGHDFRIAALSARHVREYITQRRDEIVTAERSVSDHTIAKELVTLRAALKLAVVDGMWRGDPRAIVPVAFAADYQARKRWLPSDEVQRLFASLGDDEAARCAFIVATSAEWGATDRAMRADVAKDKSCVRVRGTKRATRDRDVPIVTEWQRSLLEYALKHARGKDGALFTAWPSPQHSLRWACKRAKIAHASFNDLRRTFAQWMRHDGVPLELIAPMMGHATTAMLQRVYGRLDADGLEARLRTVIDPRPACAPPESQTMAALAGSTNRQEVPSASENTGRNEVGRVGIEPTTNGLKVPRVLWPNPGKQRPAHGPRDTRATQAPHALTPTHPRERRS